MSGEHVGNGNSNGNGGDSDVDVVVGNGVERKRCGYFFASTTHIRAVLVRAIMYQPDYYVCARLSFMDFCATQQLIFGQLWLVP